MLKNTHKARIAVGRGVRRNGERGFHQSFESVKLGRSAGPPVVVDGRVHTWRQDCRAFYGAKVYLVRIEELTRLAYRERVVDEIAPQSGTTAWKLGAPAPRARSQARARALGRPYRRRRPAAPVLFLGARGLVAPGRQNI